MKKHVLVTGGAGFIGSHVVDKLADRGDHVVILDNFDDYYPSAQKKKNLEKHYGNANVELVEADIRKKGVFDKIFEIQRIDVVVHLAARAGVRPSLENPKLYYDVNVMGTLNLLEAMREHNIKQLVFGSSSSVYGNRNDGPFMETDVTDRQVSPYGASKKTGEVLAHTYAHLHEIQTTCLRFFTVYGPRNRPDMACYLFTDAIIQDKPLLQFGDGTSGRDYTYVADIVSGVLAAIDNPFKFEIINLGNSSPVLLHELIRNLESETGISAMIDRKPMPPGDVQLTYADITKAKHLLGYDPKTELPEGFHHLVEWYKQI